MVFTTGYDRIENLPAALEQSPLLSKPVADADLRAALRRTVGEPGARQPERAGL